MVARMCVCGQIVVGVCQTCSRRRDATKHHRRPRESKPERRRREDAVSAHRAVYGDWCPGWGDRLPHEASDLTADHITPVAAGGPEDGPLAVLCRACNGAKGANA